MPERMPAARPDLLPDVYRVGTVVRETADVVSLGLVPANGGEVPPWLPGQFNMVYAFGRGEIPVSMSGDPADRSRLTHSIRAVGAVSTALTRLEPGMSLGIRGPYGSAWPGDPGRGGDLLLVAGGIGLLPLRPVIYSVLADRRRYGRVMLAYGGRRPADLVFRREVEQWSRGGSVEVAVTVDLADEHWEGHVGTVLPLLDQLRPDPARLTAFVCGPEVMMTRTLAELGRRGVPSTRLFLSVERNMKCAIGLCGHCQLGADFVCRDGAVFSHAHAAARLAVPEL